MVDLRVVSVKVVPSRRKRVKRVLVTIFKMLKDYVVPIILVVKFIKDFLMKRLNRPYRKDAT